MFFLWLIMLLHFLLESFCLLCQFQFSVVGCRLGFLLHLKKINLHFFDCVNVAAKSVVYGYCLLLEVGQLTKHSHICPRIDDFAHKLYYNEGIREIS